LRASLTGVEKLTLRITCQDPAGTVTISDAVLRQGE
jgi:hypothetical protein